MGLAYYAPPVVFAPIYNSYAYGYGYSDCGFSPYGSAFCDPFYAPYAFGRPVYAPYAFYSPFYDPFFSVSFGFGRPWPGYGYGRGYYGGAYAYDPYFYGGYYGGGAYYGRGYRGYNRNGGYYGNRPVVRADGSSSGHAACGVIRSPAMCWLTAARLRRAAH